MTGEPNNLEIPEELITINTPAEAHFWAKRLSISPFTLFQLLKTVGNRLTDIVDFLHRGESMPLKKKNKLKESTIL